MRNVTTLLILLVALLTAACSPIAPGLTPLPDTPEAAEVGVVIALAEGESSTFLVGVNADASALDALLATGEEVAVLETDFGPAICAIMGVGQPAEDCFGDAEGRYWAFFTLGAAGEWEAAQVGAGGYPVSAGEVLGFSWTASDADFNPLMMPPVVTFDEIAGE